MCSRGHNLIDVLSVYPISTVDVLVRAAHSNRITDSMTGASVAAVGAVHAIEAGFSGKQPQALKKYNSNLERAQKRLAVKGRSDQKSDANALFSGFAGQQVVKGTHERRRSKTESSR